MSCAQVESPAVSRLCVDRESRATLTYSAASPSCDPAQNEFFKPFGGESCRAGAVPTGILRPEDRFICST
ncbi:hypothetical protein PBY51_016804 [Eleginops maclovinus]|uniref:Uncharacterized protein n=1 Tax=Eleginops maclovinus TaxID=56733 RepID=A0AAN7W8S9_ELEMC|nr:hypothetical protein PBY51_016804 [Eleginops maclovinus]